MLTDGKDDGFSNLAADRIAQRIFEKCFAEELVGGFGEKTFFKLSLFECLGMVVPFVILERDDETGVG